MPGASKGSRQGQDKGLESKAPCRRLWPGTEIEWCSIVQMWPPNGADAQIESPEVGAGLYYCRRNRALGQLAPSNFM